MTGVIYVVPKAGLLILSTPRFGIQWDELLLMLASTLVDSKNVLKNIYAEANR
jgi:hypothetical protein